MFRGNISYLLKVKKSMPKERQVLLVLFIYSFLLLLLVGSDGMLREGAHRVDSAWFFMCGKAWFSGQIPYVDFTDSKGPLLWLIYGLGYSISHYNYYGVFIFEVVFYWLTFFNLYKCGKLILKNDAQSILASMLMGFLFFYPGLHSEIRAEDFCQLFQITIFYILLKIYYCNSIRKYMVLLTGLCCACTLLIKYSYFLTSLIPSVFIFIYWIKRNNNIWIFLCYFFIGFFIIILPFVIFFGIIGNLWNFINEYFTNTGFTILKAFNENNIESLSWKRRWPFNIRYLFIQDHYLSEFMRIVSVGLFLTFYKLKHFKMLNFTLLAWYVGSIGLFSLIDAQRYYLLLCVFGFIGITSLISWVNQDFQITFKGSIIMGALILLGLHIISSCYAYSEFSYSIKYKQVKAQRQIVADIINEREKQIGRRPTLVFYYTFDTGEHIPTNVIPGIRYWAYQYGMTEEMETQHKNEILTKKPDFIIIGQDNKIGREMLNEHGYRLVYTYDPWGEVGENKDSWIRCLYERQL